MAICKRMSVPHFFERDASYLHLVKVSPRAIRANLPQQVLNDLQDALL